jgi:cytochrome b subunit of formate dehydrogenase
LLAVVMTLTGFLLWFNNFTLRHFPKWVSDASTAVHFYEAILATFSILIWHFYMVVFDPDVYPMDLAWITGKVPAEHYRHTCPAYFRELERENQPPVSSDATPASSGDSGADEKNEHPGKSSEPSSKGENH